MGIEEDYDECYLENTGINLSKRDNGSVRIKTISAPFPSGSVRGVQAYDAEVNHRHYPTQKDLDFHLNRLAEYQKMIEIIRKEVKKDDSQEAL